MAFDFDALLNTAIVGVFGDDTGAEYRRPFEPSFFVPGVLSRDYVEVSLGPDGAPVSARQTRFFTYRSAFPPDFVPRQDDELTIDGGDYTVADVRPDTAHGLLLILAGRLDPADEQP